MQHKPILYFTLGSIFTLSTLTPHTYLLILSLISFISLTNTSLLYSQSLHKFICCLLIEYLVLYNTILEYINFQIYNKICGILLCLIVCLYTFNFKKMYVKWFFVFCCLYCKCFVCLLGVIRYFRE